MITTIIIFITITTRKNNTISTFTWQQRDENNV